MKTEFEKKEFIKHINLLNSNFFDDAKGGGVWWNTKEKLWETYPHILQHQESLKNLFPHIRQEVMSYFKEYDIAWWREDDDRYFPTGNLLSSQIHCLNHLFALREDKDAVLAVINKATNMDFDEVLPSTLDNDGGYIAFEFAYKNDELLGENDKGARRGVLCTSIDAMIEARKGKDKWLIPIEWKYTETYEKEDKTCKKRLERYEELIKKSDRLKMPENGQIPHSIYFQEPSYELMRQTLLCEQLIAKDYAVDFFHINIIPKENTKLRKAVENEFMQPNSGIVVNIGAGILEHHIRIENRSNNTPPVLGDYKKGYDGLRNGIALRGFIGYQFLSNKKLVNFYGGVEYTFAWTKSIRNYDFNLRGKDNTLYHDSMIGIRVGWILPVYRHAPEEYYYY